MRKTRIRCVIIQTLIKNYTQDTVRCLSKRDTVQKNKPYRYAWRIKIVVGRQLSGVLGVPIRFFSCLGVPISGLMRKVYPS
jgi:hypothetical protein